MEALPSGTIICRTGWCDRCAKENRPHTGQHYLALGASGNYHVYIVQRIAPFYGFTPHLYRIIKVINQDVIYEMCCCMHHCGVERKQNNVDQCWDYITIKSQWRRGMMLLKDWNALQQFKRDNDYIV